MAKRGLASEATHIRVAAPTVIELKTLSIDVLHPCVLDTCHAQVAARLPPPVQVLNAALALSKRAERDGVVQQALGGGRGEVPGTTLDALGAAAHQLIDDMEDQQVCVGVCGGPARSRGGGASSRIRENDGAVLHRHEQGMCVGH